MPDFLNQGHIACIVTKPNGQVLKIDNYSRALFLAQVSVGSLLEDDFPLFHGYFPFTQNEVILENMAFEDFSGNIFCKNENAEVSIYFYPSTESDDQWSKIVQNYNQEKLINKLVMKANSANMSSNVMYTLGFMSFEKNNNGIELQGNVPDWFKRLFPNYNYSSSVFDLDQLFPFLEVFLPEVNEMYEKSENGKLISGIWAAYTHENEEVILQATAVKENGAQLFFIESLSERFPNQHKNIQHAREKILEHQQLVKTEKKLRQLFENQEQFISMFSHDIKGPLSGAYALLQILQKDKSLMENLSSNQSELLGIMHKGLKDLYDYAFRLQDWSRVHFGNIMLDFSTVNLKLLVINVHELNKNALQEKQLKLDIDIPATLNVKVDEPFFKNVLQNLVNNAIKFSHLEGTIAITAVEKNGETTISVKDQGVGMTEEVKKLLFAKTNIKSSRGTKGEKGTGIGLNVVKRIMDLHKGKIDIKSEEDKGTTVALILSK